MKFTQIPSTTFQNLQMNAGILLSDFNPSTGEYSLSNIIGATSGGNSFSDSISTTDLGDDIDNCPKNMMELKQLDSHEVKMSGTFVTVSASMAKLLAGAADVDSSDATHIVPRNDFETTDFTDIWWVGDYSDVNTGANAGFLAIHIMNALNTGGFQITSTDRGKGQFAFEFTGHYTMSDQDKVPYEIYVQQGSSEGGVTTYPVTQNLTNVTSTFSGSTITSGSEFSATLTADDNYTISSVTVTMGTDDVTSTAYDETSGEVSIENVTDAITIVATATYE